MENIKEKLTIYRYELNGAVCDLEVPYGAKFLGVDVVSPVTLKSFVKGFLSFATEHKSYPTTTKSFFRDLFNYCNSLNMKETVCVWAEVDPDNLAANNTEVRRLVTFGTGADMSSIVGYNRKPIGSYSKANNYRFHVYEVSKK